MTEGIVLTADTQECINYAMYQNGISIIRSVIVTNNSGMVLDNAEIFVRSEPAFLKTTSMKVSDVESGHTLNINPKETLTPLSVIDDDYLINLSERLNGKIVIELVANGTVISTIYKEVGVMPYDEWPGMSESGIISAFVTPNSKSMAMIRSKASDALGQMHAVTSLEGYQSKDRQRVHNMVAALFSAFKTININYVSPPPGFEKTGQRIRMPDAVVADREGTCLDLSVAFASAAESIGLNPIIVFLKNHAFAGVWLDDNYYPDIAVYDMASITREVRNGAMCIVECTAMVNDNEIDFEESKRLAMAHLNDDSQFECAIDIKRARLIIKPLPLRYTLSGKFVVEREDTTYTPEAPNKVNEDVVLGDTKTLTKLDIWERKLLDVSLKNNLIRLRRGKRLMPLMVGDSSIVEDKLSEGIKFSIYSKPQEWDGQEMFNKVPYESSSYISNYNDGYSAEVARGIIRTPLSDTETKNLLKSLYRDAKRESEENGSNSLFLTLGVLKWYDESNPNEAIYAPLILMPVSITRSVSCYTLKTTDEETIMNVTLLEKLSGEGIEIPGLDPLPEDESGIDVNLVFNTVRKCISGKQGWDVIDSSFIGIFSFNQFVMWKDLTQFSDRLAGNKIVRSLMNQQLCWQPEEIPVDSDPYGLCLTVSADSSQIRAVRASGEGISFVLHGPPGTGKSQTITNMISNALFYGKTVLFVAEKRAALEVVEKRLSAIGIANHCLEVHSNRADKASVLDQLRSAYTTAQEITKEELEEKLEQVCRKRDALDQYVSNLHKIQPFGISIYEAISEYEKIPEEKTFYKEIIVPYQIIEGGKKELANVCDAIDRIMAMHGLIDHDCEYRKFVLTRESSISLISDLEKVIHDVKKNNEALIAIKSDLAEKGVTFDYETKDSEAFVKSLDDLDLSAIPDMKNVKVYSSYKDSIGSVKKLVSQCDANDVASASTTFEESKKMLEKAKADGCFTNIGSLDLLINRFNDLVGKISELENAKKAMTKFWKLDAPAFNKQFGISEQWTKAANAGLLSRKKMRNAFMEAISSHLITPMEFDDVKTTLTLVNQYDDRKKELEEASANVLDKNFLKTVDEDLCSIEKTVRTSEATILFSEEYGVPVKKVKELKEHAKEIGLNIGEYRKKLAEIKASFAEASQLIGCDFNAYTTEQGIAILNGLWEHINEVQDWIEWNRCKDSMKGWGLETIMEHLDKGKDPKQIKDSFLKALYIRIIRDGISQSPNLRIFNSKQFEESIEDFKKMDQEYTEYSKKMLKYMLSKRVPTNIDSYGDSENHILSRTLQGQTMKMSIRSLFSKIPTLLTRLCPCMLMSPLSVSQYLSPEMQNFDIVIFDEASQIPTYKAVASLARGDNAVIVGDPKQLPPTSFFDRKKEVDETEIDDDMEDLESFLDDCLSLNMPQAYLEWHYRSKHESLISFSNRTYYGNRMLTFPSYNDIETRIGFRLVDGLYERGKRVNVVEAEAIADEVIARKKDSEHCDESLGVITFNIAQQDLIEDLVIEKIGKDGQLYEKVLGGNEPTFFKNIESVQGDERDIILFSICFGPSGKDRVVYQNFGPLNKAGGGRRLNVAVSRARKEMVVFSSMTADGIRPSITSSDGVVNLKEFIRFAQNAGRFPEDAKVTSNESNYILADIAKEINGLGYKTNFNVGNSEFRVEIGIVDPNDPDRYVMGIISDGGSYKAANNTRDREYGRFDVLRNLGWNLFFIWSVEWLYKRDAVIAELKKCLEERPATPQTEERNIPEEEPEKEEEEGFNPYYSVGVKTVKRVCRWKKEVDAFEPDVHISDFKPPLKPEDVLSIAKYMMEKISPISDGYLAYCVQKVYGTKMTVTYMDMIRTTMASNEDVVVMSYVNRDHTYTTYYKKGTPVSAYGKYFVSKDGNQRQIQQLAIEEVISAVIFVTATVPSSDKDSLCLSAIRELGYARGGQKIKDVVMDAIDIATEKNYINISEGRYVLNPAFKIGDITIDVETDEISEGLMKKKRSIDDFTDEKIKATFMEAFTKEGLSSRNDIYEYTTKTLGFKKMSAKMKDRFDSLFDLMFRSNLDDTPREVVQDDSEGYSEDDEDDNDEDTNGGTESPQQPSEPLKIDWSGDGKFRELKYFPKKSESEHKTQNGE